MALYVAYTPPPGYVNPYKSNQGQAGPDWKNLSTEVVVNKLGGADREAMLHSYLDSMDAEFDQMAEKQRNHTATQADYDRYMQIKSQIAAVKDSIATDPKAAEYNQWLDARSDRVNMDAGNLGDELGFHGQPQPHVGRGG